MIWSLYDLFKNFFLIIPTAMSVLCLISKFKVTRYGTRRTGYIVTGTRYISELRDGMHRANLCDETGL